MRELSSTDIHKMLGIPRRVKTAVTDLLSRLHGAYGHQQAAAVLFDQLGQTGDINSAEGQSALRELIAHHNAAGQQLRAALSCAELNDELRTRWLSAVRHLER
jgi:hypothetical protein